MARAEIQEAKRWVIKIGSAVLTDDGRGLDRASIQHWVEQIVELRQRGIEIVLVSSGAVAEGMSRLGWKNRPEALHELQAAAAIGQMGLVQAYESCFQQYGIHTAQILLDHDDLSNRERYLNARSTMQTLIELGQFQWLTKTTLKSQMKSVLGTMTRWRCWLRTLLRQTC